MVRRVFVSPSEPSNRFAAWALILLIGAGFARIRLLVGECRLYFACNPLGVLDNHRSDRTLP
jgi:hypothetical protein